MPTLRASVLIVGHPNPAKISFGADFADDLKAARKSLGEFRYPVIALPISRTNEQEVIELLEYANRESPLSQRVIIQNDTGADALRAVINSGSVFRVLSVYHDPRFDLTIQEALEEYRLLRQNMKLLQLVNEQNDRLKKLSAELEERVEARKRSIEEAKGKLLVTNHRVEALHRALVAIHQAGSIAEMERLINEALSGALGLSWTRILFQSQGRIDPGPALNSKTVALHTAPLMRGGDRFKETLGHVHFARSAEAPFSRDETGFLGQIADAVALAIDRLGKLEQSETLKHQWEATFDAIVDPVCLITDDFTLVRVNRSFAERSNAAPEKIIGHKCHEALFGRPTPCEGCGLTGVRQPQPPAVLATGSSFRLKPARTAGMGQGQEANVIYDVFSQEIQFKPDGRSLHVNMYHDMSSQLRLERQIVESAKMAELGTIGSSIAHELNNPLGGMLSFLQLIKMDLDRPTNSEDASQPQPTSAWRPDINEMELAARRCRDIVQSLLGFTRKSGQDTDESIDLCEVVEQALKITELQTRSMGIVVKYELPSNPVQTRGQFNALAQALRNFLQNAQEAITEKRRESKFQGEITIQLNVTEEWNEIEITDNGVGFDPNLGEMIYHPMYTTKDPANNPGLGLTVAQQIIRDHDGRVEISSSRESGTSAKISLPRAKGVAVSSSF